MKDNGFLNYKKFLYKILFLTSGIIFLLNFLYFLIDHTKSNIIFFNLNIMLLFFLLTNSTLDVIDVYLQKEMNEEDLIKYKEVRKEASMLHLIFLLITVLINLMIYT